MFLIVIDFVYPIPISLMIHVQDNSALESAMEVVRHSESTIALITNSRVPFVIFSGFLVSLLVLDIVKH